MRRATDLIIKLGTQTFKMECHDYEEAQWYFHHAIAGALFADENQNHHGTYFSTSFAGDQLLLRIAESKRDEMVQEQRESSQLQYLKDLIKHIIKLSGVEISG